MKITVLYLGHIYCEKNELISTTPGEMVKSPISALLIQHPKLGNRLYDMGNSPFYSTEYPEDIRKTYPIPEFISIADALEWQGMTVRDIDGIILSHLHFDHVGGLRYFAGIKALQNVMVSEAELKNAFAQVVTKEGGAYVRDTFDLCKIRWKLEEEEELELQRIFVSSSSVPTPPAYWA